MNTDAATTPADITAAIIEAATAIAHEVTCSPVTPFVGAPQSYRFGAVSGDREILAEQLGRAPTADEIERVEAEVHGAIEDALGAMADAATE